MSTDATEETVANSQSSVTKETVANSQSGVTSLPANKKPKLCGGLLFAGNEALTLDGKNRYDFFIPPLNGKKKTLDELSSGSQSLFPVGRHFL